MPLAQEATMSKPPQQLNSPWGGHLSGNLEFIQHRCIGGPITEPATLRVLINLYLIGAGFLGVAGITLTRHTFHVLRTAQPSAVSAAGNGPQKEYI